MPRSQVPVAAWTEHLGSPAAEPSRSRRLARLGGVASILAVITYLTWRITSTLPAGGNDLRVAWVLIAFETLPIFGLVLKTIALWSIDAPAPAPVTGVPNGMRVAVLIPTYNEPAEVIAPTIAAACALEPAHETWVLDDGDRGWLREMCAEFGARYVCRPIHDHAKAGNLNHALGLMETEAANGADPIDVIAVLDCDHVPLPTFLTATLGWFADARVALVQGPQAFYNAGAFDDDGYSGEQGLFFNVLMPARHHAGAGPFWCGSTSLLRVSALREVGGVATETITEDMHTTLKLIRAGWQTRYHHQTLAVGLAPATPEQYLLQRRRWGMGAMQILVHEKLWAAKRWMSWRNYHEYLNGTLWWLEGVATLVAFVVPIAVLAYSALGLAGVVPWGTGAGSTVASGVWLALAGTVLVFGSRRIRLAEFATSRRNAYRVAVRADVEVDGITGELLDISVGGAKIRFPGAWLPQEGLVELRLPNAPPMKMEMVRIHRGAGETDLGSVRARPGDWSTFRTMSLWMFHTPPGAVAGLPEGTPVIACTSEA